jgi:hypothetical protein
MNSDYIIILCIRNGSQIWSQIECHKKVYEQKFGDDIN